MYIRHNNTLRPESPQPQPKPAPKPEAANEAKRPAKPSRNCQTKTSILGEGSEPWRPKVVDGSSFLARERSAFCTSSLGWQSLAKRLSLS